MSDKLEQILIRIAQALERLAPAPNFIRELDETDTYLWSSNSLELFPVENYSVLDPDHLLGVDSAKHQILENTVQFARGYSANNVLLWGSRGTGKSSLVKATHGEVCKHYKNLKLIEIRKSELHTLDTMLEILSNIKKNYRYIIFCDDLSFLKDDDDYKSLKVSLEGGLLEKSSNIIFYVTSNRKHLLPRRMIENEEEQAITRSEATEEKVSLSDRFGILLGFYPCTQEQYLEMVLNYKKAFKIPIENSDLLKGAIEWQQGRGARSGRVAWQYVISLAGSLGVELG